MVSTPATGKDREYPVYFCPTEDLTIFFFINKIRLCSRLFLVPWTEKLRIWLNDNNCDMPHLNSIQNGSKTAKFYAWEFSKIAQYLQLNHKRAPNTRGFRAQNFATIATIHDHRAIFIYFSTFHSFIYVIDSNKIQEICSVKKGF